MYLLTLLIQKTREVLTLEFKILTAALSANLFQDAISICVLAEN